MTEETPKKKRRWKYQIDLGPLSMLVWVICIFFFLAWIFVLGIFVGRGFLPDSISNLSDLKGEINKFQTPVVTKDAKEEKAFESPDPMEKEPELAFYDKLTTKKDDARSSIQSEAIPEAPKPTPAPPRETVEAQPSISDKKVTAPPAVSDKKMDALFSAVPATKIGSGKYTIQVASIAGLSAAQKAVKQLVDKGFDAYYYETKVKGKTYYRIRCGKFQDRAEAVETALKLQEKTGYKGYVTGSE
jgi:septal ring-binding cell division protein DamX